MKAPSAPEATSYRFGDCTLDLTERRLLRAGKEIPLRPKTFDVLAFLVGHHAHLVRRQELFDAAWPEVEVTDNALTRCVKEIRRALEDDVRQPRYVQTVHKLGYKFIAEVTDDELVEAQSAGTPRSPTLDGSVAGNTREPLGSIAVLPFADLSPEQDQEYFCDGVAEEILTALARLEGLRVVARTSAFAFKGRNEDVRVIGAKLDVEALLEGSVRRSGERLRITVQLVSAQDGSHLWSERFHFQARDVLAIQDQISAAVAERIRPERSPRPQTPPRRRATLDPEAYRLYLHGRFFLNRRHPGDFERALAYYHQALARDPRYAAPSAGVASAFIVSGAWGFAPPREAFPRAREAALVALANAEDLAEAHLALALVALLHERDREEADRHFEMALRLGLDDPLASAWYSIRLLDAERYAEAITQAEHGLHLDPLSPSVHTNVGFVYLALGRLREARDLLEKAVELDPRSPIGLHWLGWCQVLQGDAEEGETRLGEAAAAGLDLASGCLGAMRAGRGDRSGALRVLDQLERREAYHPRFPVAMVYAALGDDSRSLALLDEAMRDGEPVVLASLGRPGCLAGLVPSPWAAEVRRRTAANRTTLV